MAENFKEEGFWPPDLLPFVSMALMGGKSEEELLHFKTEVISKKISSAKWHSNFIPVELEACNSNEQT